ncbi:hypothetical protein [Leeia oryzae]|uniref:hypothetical protein n=1 Tax=Leeia oryzae TaxID=356662 RepID=UPI0003829862|nr:hypothetical protein [Leeia oryzae]
MPYSLQVPSPKGEPAGAFSDARAAKLWLQQTPLLNTPVAQVQLLGYMRQLNQVVLSHRERLKILELLREPVIMVQSVEGQKYVARPLPFATEQQKQWDLVCELWIEMLYGYWIVQDAANKHDPDALEFAAFSGQRMIYFISRWIYEFYLTYRKVPGMIWALLHQTYQTAQREGWVDKKVRDTHLPGGEGSVSMAHMFAQVIFLSQANTSKLSIKQLAFVDALLFVWRDKCSVSTEADLSDKYEPFTIDLESTSAVSLPHERVSEEVCYLHRDALLVSLAKRIKMLRDGQAWDLPQLTDMFLPAGGLPFLTLLYKFLSEKRGRVLPRHQANEEVLLGGDWGQIYSQLSGMLFDAKDSAPELSAKTLAEFQLFGKRASETYHAREYRPQVLPALETWLLKDQSTSGLGLMTRQTIQRWQQNQLVILQRTGQQPVMGVVRRLLFDDDGTVELGLSSFGGLPVAAVVRATGAQALAVAPQPAVMLPAFSDPQQQEMILMPAGLFHPGNVAQIICDGKIRQARLVTLIERGHNFDCYQFDWT